MPEAQKGCEVNISLFIHKQTHVNPCFHGAAPASGSLKPLPRNKWQQLCDGDKFSLLPDTCVFTVVHRADSAKKDADSDTDVDEDMQAAAEAAKASSTVSDKAASTAQQSSPTVTQGSPTAASSTRSVVMIGCFTCCLGCALFSGPDRPFDCFVVSFWESHRFDVVASCSDERHLINSKAPESEPFNATAGMSRSVCVCLFVHIKAIFIV